MNRDQRRLSRSGSALKMVKSDRDQRRLSKPRSLKHSSSGHLDFSGESLNKVTPPRSGADNAELCNAQKQDSAKRSKSRTRGKLRAYLYGSPAKSSDDAVSDEEEASPLSNLPENARNSKSKLSRSGSGFTQRSSARNSTTLLANVQSTGLNGVDDLEDADNIAKQVKQRAQHDSLAAGNHKPLPMDEEAHCDSFLPPIRRKSLFTPGLATRNASDILRKPSVPADRCPQTPLSDADLNYYYDKSHPESSPLARLAALKLSDDGRGTPGSLNIPNIGGLKHGTLRVTNGIGSPIVLSPRPVSICHSPTLSCTDPGDYHTASEGSICEKRGSPLLAPIAVHESGTSPALLRESSQHDAEPLAMFEDPVVGDKSALSSVLALEYIAELGEAPDEIFKDSDKAIEYSVTSDHSALSSTLALDYIAELGEAPFSQSEPCSRSSSRAQQATNDTAVTQTWSRLPEQSHHIQASTTTSFDAGQIVDQQASATRYNHRPLLVNYSTTHTTTSTLTRDSGYQSSESVNQIGLEKAEVEAQQYPSELKQNDLMLQISIRPASSGAKVKQSVKITPIKTNSTLQRTQASSRKLQKARPIENRLPVPELIHAGVHASLADVVVPRVPSAMAVRNARRLVDFPVLEHTYPSSNHIRAAESVQLRHKFPAMLSFPETSPTDKNFPSTVVDETMPPSCSRPQLRQSRRWSSFGTSPRSVNQKKLTKQSQKSEWKEEESRPRRLEQEEEEGEEEGDDYGEVKAQSWRSRATSRIRGKSTDGRPSHEHQGTIADLGTVAHSIGSSPYDIATSITPKAIRDRPGYSPHQLGAVKSRPRSFVGMDDLTASELAHAKSRRRQQHGRERPKTICMDTVVLDDSTTSTNVQEDWRDAQTLTLGSVHQRTQSLNVEQSMNDRRGTMPASVRDPRPCALGTRQTLHDTATRSKPISKDGRIPNTGDGIDWQDHQNAWRQRRKSAGFALQTAQPACNSQVAAGHDPRLHAQDRRDMLPPRRLSMSPAIAALAGRYEGGFDFGFERGCGVGGSAGTRSQADATARKSYGVSKGYGLDLSDLPVFVAAAPR